MLLDLTKPMKELPGALPAPPQLPVPPPPRLVDVWGCPVPPPKPKEPSRIWCFFGVHKYQVKDESTWKKTYDGMVMSKGPMYVLRCDVCGKMKSVCL